MPSFSYDFAGFGVINATSIAASGAITAGTTVTAGTGITATTGAVTATAGAVVAGTTVTAGTGLTVTTGAVSMASSALTASTVAATSVNVASSAVVINTTGVDMSSGTGLVVANQLNVAKVYFSEGTAPSALANFGIMYVTDVAGKTRISVKAGAGGTTADLVTEV